MNNALLKSESGFFAKKSTLPIRLKWIRSNHPTWYVRKVRLVASLPKTSCAWGHIPTGCKRSSHLK